MSSEIIATPRFKKELKRLAKKFHSLKHEYESLIGLLEREPTTGVSLGRNCYKIRLSIASKGKGKSGSARVVTHCLVDGNVVYLLTIYDKSDQDSIDDAEITTILKGIQS